MQAGRPRGRPATFDRDAVLDDLVLLFWERGYDHTTHQDIRARTGLSGSSLHHTFGDKPEIFALALTRYQERAQALVDELAGGDRGLDDLRGYVAMMERAVDDEDSPAGCLMISTGAQPVNRVPAVQRRTAAYRDRWRSAFRAALDRAADRGEIPSGSADARAWLLLAAHVGIMIAAGDGTRQEARAMVAGLRALVEQWAADGPANDPPR